MTHATAAPILDDLPDTAYPCTADMGVGDISVQAFVDLVNGTFYFRFGLEPKRVGPEGLHGLVTAIEDGERRLFSVDGRTEGVMVLGPADGVVGMSWFFTEIWTESQDPDLHHLTPQPRWAWNDITGKPEMAHHLEHEGNTYYLAFESHKYGGGPTTLHSFLTDIEGTPVAVIQDHKTRYDDYPGAPGVNQDACDARGHAPSAFT